ncbi:hypothetical protein POWCR01_000117900 [Plasmodium ovale]|uniref:PIR protein n=1 Tax=Plasmodium ovale TaxID=36330 RepID=A0A1C3KI56_PLAOA|nr:hypothetical protein POWCR01_000117900 [Plasmodium ovale]
MFNRILLLVKKYSFVSSYNVIKSKLDSYNEGGPSQLSDLCNNYSNNFNNVKSTCYKVLMFLNYLEQRNNPHYIVSGCRFLNYWLYNNDELKEKNTFNAVNFYESLKGRNHHYFYNDLCGGNIEHISEEIIANIRMLIELHEKFDKIVPTKEPLDYICEQTLACANLYGTYMKEFCVDINNVFCVELENFKPKYDAYMKNKKCGENFTSFGPWLLSRIRKNNRIFNNLNDENNHISLRDSESHEPYMNERAYHIAYRSTINS